MSWCQWWRSRWVTLLANGRQQASMIVNGKFLHVAQQFHTQNAQNQLAWIPTENHGQIPHQEPILRPHQPSTLVLWIAWQAARSTSQITCNVAVSSSQLNTPPNLSLTQRSAAPAAAGSAAQLQAAKSACDDETAVETTPVDPDAILDVESRPRKNTDDDCEERDSYWRIILNCFGTNINCYRNFVIASLLRAGSHCDICYELMNSRNFYKLLGSVFWGVGV